MCCLEYHLGWQGRSRRQRSFCSHCCVELYVGSGRAARSQLSMRPAPPAKLFDAIHASFSIPGSFSRLRMTAMRAGSNRICTSTSMVEETSSLFNFKQRIMWKPKKDRVPCGTTMHDQNEKQIILAKLRKRLLHINL